LLIESRHAAHRVQVGCQSGSPGTAVVEVSAPARTGEAGLSAPGEVRWHVLHTRARQEKAISRALTAAGIDHYLPLRKRMTYRGVRKCVVEEPIFASYLFLRGTLEATYFAVATKRVANVIHVADQERFVAEVRQIRRALDNGAELSPYGYLRVGRRVRVTAGPFHGIEGLIEDRAKPDRLVLQVAALGRATSLEIDAGLLEAAD